MENRLIRKLRFFLKFKRPDIIYPKHRIMHIDVSTAIKPGKEDIKLGVLPIV